MTPYSVFARYYDTLMADVDYAAQADYLRRLFECYGASPRLILDLGCGTGSLLMELVRAGYEVVGADANPMMLSAAAQKLAGSEAAVLVCQRMQELDLYGTVDAAVCMLDGINHLKSAREVLAAFRRVSLFLNPGGLFIFDINSVYKFQRTLACNAFIYDCDDVYCIWQNAFSQKSGLCRFDLTFFECCGSAYTRSDESFCERAYPRKKIEFLLKEAGLEPLAAYDGYGLKQAGETSERIVFVARKKENACCECK
ncbi:MAG: class I SAM-dependent methyltransferase [Clostridia bacterium]|nr:class I SAM-dependent methyltransferase [Clostridia bacterium]